MARPAGSGRTAGRAAATVGAAALLVKACGSTVPPTAQTATTVAVAVDAPACPDAQAGGPGPTSPETPVRPGLDAVLVPTGPSVATVCRYGGLGTTSEGAGAAVARATVTGADLHRLVSELDATTWRVIDGSVRYSCPNWDGALDLVRFAYPSGPGVEVSVDLGGCGFASNGVRTVEGNAIGRYLARWVGDPDTASA